MGGGSAGSHQWPPGVPATTALTQPHRPDRATLLAFSTAVLIGGVNFVGVRFSNRELPPVFGAGVRFALAAVLLLLLVSLRRIPLPRGRALVVSLAYGVLSFTCSYALAYWALQELSAGVGAVLFAATPLVTVFLAPLHKLERFRLRGLIGSLVVLAGIAILASPGAGETPILPILAMLGSTVTAAEAAVLVKKYPTGNPLATNAVAMGIGSVVLLAISAVAGEEWAAPRSTTTWLVVIYLAAVGSAGLFGLFLFTLSRWTASATSYFTALMPVVSMVAGAILASEAITLAGALGGAIVLLGVYVGALSNPQRRLQPSIPG